jgi:hypothetical protein
MTYQLIVAGQMRGDSEWKDREKRITGEKVPGSGKGMRDG